MRKATNIFQRKDGRYEGRYADGYLPSGKRRYRSVFDKEYSVCKEKLGQAKLKVAMNGAERKPVAGKERETVAGAVGAHLDASKCVLKASTLAVYERYLINHIAPYFGKTLCATLTTEELQKFVNNLIESGLSVPTVQSVFTLLRTSVKAVEKGLFDDIKMPKKPKIEVEFFTVDEQKKLEAAALEAGNAVYIAVTLCLYTGIRIGEVSGLQWSDVDLDAGIMRINRTMQRINGKNGGNAATNAAVNGVTTPNDGAEDGDTVNAGEKPEKPAKPNRRNKKIEGEEKKTKIVFQTPKSASSARAIPLPDFMTALLLEHKKNSRCEFVVSRRNKPMEPRVLQYQFKKICADAGLEDTNFHSTRHTFCVRALESGFDIKSLSDIMGHSSATVTLKRYAHATDEQKRTCMNSLAGVYGKEQQA